MAVRAPLEERSRRARAVLLRVLWMNLAVVGVKVGAYLASGALSIVAEVTHSSLDAANNVFALWIARIAGREPDEQHPYGHHKFEMLGALVLVGLLSITVFELAKGALARLLESEPPPVHASGVAVGLMVVGVAAGVAISRYEGRLGKVLGSDLLLADAAHTRSDVFTTLGVLAGLVLVRLGLPRIDPVVTLAVAAAITWTGWRIVRAAVPVLVDERAVPPERIRELAEADARVLSCYRVRSRGRPGEIFAELTIAVDGDMHVAESHAVADAVEERVGSALGAQEVVVHVEPGR
jgi:cation diffusion facilitator family transporter